MRLTGPARFGFIAVAMRMQRVTCTFWSAVLAFGGFAGGATAGSPATVELVFPPPETLLCRLVADSAYAGDNAGATIRFATDATNLTLRIAYVDQAQMGGHAYFLSQGEWQVDGQTETNFTRTASEGGTQSLALALPGPPRLCQHAILLPLADRATLLGVALNPGATTSAVPPPPAHRLVAYGDSITQGFFASRPSAAYPLRLAQETGWEVLNMGFCGRIVSPEDAQIIAAQKPDAVVILMGVNDALSMTDLALFRERFSNLITNLTTALPARPVLVITPLPVLGGKWAADGVETYREAIRSIVGNSPGSTLHLVEGSDMLSADKTLFADGLHPNDAGFDRLARNVAKTLRDLGISPP
jgi:lysophospholipase L1-like esterase